MQQPFKLFQFSRNITEIDTISLAHEGSRTSVLEVRTFIGVPRHRVYGCANLYV